MNSIGKTATFLAACALGSAAALAQTGTPATAPQTTSPTTAAPDTPTATPISVTDAEVTQFAAAVLAVQKIQQDSSVAAADKQPQMAAAVKATGLTPERFNAIAKASQTDQALHQRIQTAVQAAAPPAPAATPSQ